MQLDDDNNGNSPQKITPGPRGKISLFFFLALLGVTAWFVLSDASKAKTIVPYSSFMTLVQEEKVTSVKIVDQITIVFKVNALEGETQEFKTTIPYVDLNLLDKLQEHNVKVEGAISGTSPWQILFDLVPWVFLLFIIWMFYKQYQGNNKAFTFGKSRAKLYMDDGNKITFNDVAGQKEAKYELTEVVDYLKNPQKFVKMGARIPKGVLLVGMPGTGKTLLAKAVAGEAGVPFFHMSGSDFVEMFVGVGASRVRDLFEQGRKNAPCIIFIDELDAVGRTRGAGLGGGHDEREQTLNQMLVEMDGFGTKDGIIILAATNRPDVLDPALLRPGRFDRQVVVAMPDIKEREDILKIHMAKVPMGPDIDVEKLARATPGMSGADLANMVNEAALFAIRRGKNKVEMQDMEEARDKVLMGVARTSMAISEEDKRATAYHESGHALLHYYVQHADPLHKVTIIPRGRALGVAFSLPEKDTFSRNKEQILDQMVILYGGYAAEEIIYSQTTTGTANDIKQATALARKMVCEWGMAEEIGPVAYGQEDEPIFLGKELARHKDYSEDTAMRIDRAVTRILSEARNRALSILTEHKDQLVALTEELIRKETLLDEEIRALFGFEKRVQTT
ncbi:MAG TPA: ATP-dependent zinc metalloprotease FtsH [Spirochaetales bacterium]|nr:ATP-dependent zinc metalloprotease FtsH [Spirochaetales bacterium]HQK33366.1 ATP-dependent zinc metalloprotease FtsH [Spirochaetales bacterium]HRV28696.1 ATP-dependent zinc metalloprotease FtsH [Spirochaetia bacterium]